jgi:hypothetical protein
VHFPSLLGNVSPPPLDIQDPGTSLPLVQASDQVRQAATTDNPAVTPAGTSVTLAIPEPGSLLLLVFAVCLGRKALPSCCRHVS